MAEYQLYCFAQSGNAYRAALMLNLSGYLSEAAQRLTFYACFPLQKPAPLLTLLGSATKC